MNIFDAKLSAFNWYVFLCIVKEHIFLKLCFRQNGKK